MSFDPRFDARWSRVLQPALRAVRRNDQPLKPFRVDLSRASDAILTEILQSIGDAVVIVADTTATAELDGRAVRNPNVMYEVGIAHAARLPEEVVLLRSDSLRLDFDIAGVRVHGYDPDGDPDGAQALVTETVVASLSALDTRRRAMLGAAADRLTLPAAALLFEAIRDNRLQHPPTRTFGQLLGSIERIQAISLLLEVGALKANLVRVTPDMLRALKDDTVADQPLLDYVLTPLGQALFQHLAHDMGAFEPAMRKHIEELMKDQAPEGAA
jgi:hypothetical protein